MELTKPDTLSSVFKIGNVISVEGRTVKVLVDKEKNTSHLLYNGELVKNVSVGSYLKITKGFEIIVGKIEGEYINEDFENKSDNYTNKKLRLKRVLKLSLLGFFDDGEFKKGIKELPLIDNECYLLTEKESNKVHNFVENDDQPITFGSLAQEKGQRVSFGINKLFASHIGIFGNTGSGKSYTLAKLYNELFQKFIGQGNFIMKSKFVFFDFNGEYVNSSEGDYDDNVIIEEEHKNIYDLTTRTESDKKFPIPKSAVNDSTIWQIIFEATEKTQTPFLNRVLKSDFLNELLEDERRLKGYVKSIVKEAVDNRCEISTIYNFLEDLKDSTQNFSSSISEVITELRRKLKFHGRNDNYYIENSDNTIYDNEDNFEQTLDNILNPISFDLSEVNQINSIHLRIILRYYDEIIKGYSEQSHIGPMIKRVKKRINELDKIVEIYDDGREGRETMQNITIISLKNVNLQMSKILPLIICKHLYESHKKENDGDKYLNIVIDEAHNILSSMSQRESERWKDYRLETFEEIIKEGRKFGAFLTIASQRPYDISPTIISQLHNYFLHRLINTLDIKAIEKTVSYLDKVSFESLSILPTGTCIIAGTVSQLPVVVEIDKISDTYKPFNQTIRPLEHWVD